MNKILRNLIIMCSAIFFAGGISAQCTYTVTASDSFGDGWNGGFIEVTVNGVLVSPAGGWTLAAGAGPEVIGTFTANLGDNMEAFFSDCSFDFESDWVITDCNGNVANSGNGGAFDDGTCNNGTMSTGTWVGVDPLPACEWIVNKFDSFGDGWDTGSLDVVVNGTVQNSLSLSGGDAGSCTVTIIDGATVDFVFSTLGSFPTEIGYQIIDPFGMEVAAAAAGTLSAADAGVSQFATTNACPIPCGIVCPTSGSGTWVEQYFLQAGECSVQVTIPVEIVGFCEIVETIDVPNSPGCNATGSVGAAGGCTASSASASNNTLFLQGSDPAAFGGGGANACTFFGSIYQYVVPEAGEFCFDYDVTNNGAGEFFGYSIGTDWDATVASIPNMMALSTTVTDSDTGGAGQICVTLNEGDIIAWLVYSDFFTNGNSFVPGVMEVLVSGLPEFVVQEVIVSELPAGPLNYQTELGIGENQVVTISYDLEDGSTIECSVEIDVFPYTGTVTSALACNDDVNISLDEECSVLIGADMFLEGGPYSCFDDYCVRIRPFGGADYLTIDSGAADPYNATGAYLALPTGQHIYEVLDKTTGNTCWGYFTIEDKFPPVLECNCPVGGEPVNLPITGELSAASPMAEWDLVNNCIPAQNDGDGVTAIAGDTPYQEWTFTPECNTSVTISAATDWGDGQLYVYNAPLDPADICAGLEAWDGDSGAGFDPVVTLDVTAGTTYYFYLSTWAPGQEGTFSINVDGAKCQITADGQATELVIAPECTFLCSDETNWEVIDELPGVTILDNCGTGDLSSNDVWLDGDCGERRLLRNWLLTDPNTGETSTCTQEFLFARISVADLSLPPATVTLPCGGDASPEAIAGVLGITSAYPHYFVGDKTYDSDGNFIGYTQRAVAVNNNVCNLFASYTDVDISDCPGCPGNKKVIRSWEILDWCDGSTTPYTQIIKASDSEAPTISAPDVTASVDPWTCTADFYLPCPEHLHDDCYGDNLNYTVIPPAGVTITQVPSTLCSTGYQYIASGAPKTMYDAPHVFTYVAVDCCGNVGEYDMNVTVLDQTPPVAIALQNIVISLTSTPGSDNGVAKMYPQSVDNGSHDGDCGPIHLEIRRADGAPACDNLGGIVSDEDEPGDCDDATEVEVQNGNVYLCYYNNNLTFNNDVPPNVPSDAAHDDDNRFDTDGGAFIKFCCEDLVEVDGSGTAFGLVEVFIRAWDDGNMTGVYGDWVDLNQDGDFQDFGELDNYSDTWAYVRVEDKLSPTIVCPADITLKCDEDYTDTNFTGYASASATCSGIGTTYTDDTDISTCGAGIVYRTWCIDGTDKCCVQKITVDYFSTWDPCDRDAGIVWPADYTGEDDPQDPWCGREINPRDPIDCADVDTGEPEWVDSPCDLIGYSLDSDTFYFESNACFKVLNNWSVINWCIYNPNDADWNGIFNQGLDPDNDGVPNLFDEDDNGDGTDSYYDNPADDFLGMDIRYYFDTEGGLYFVNYSLSEAGRDYSIDIWDLILVDVNSGYFGEFDPEAEDDGIADGLYTHTQVIKLIDEVAPEVIAPEECFAVGDGCVALPPVKATACDTLSNCNSEWIKWQVDVDLWGDWTVDFEYSSFIPDIPLNDPGNAAASSPYYLEPSESCEEITLEFPYSVEASKYQHRVLWTATDGCGNVTSYTSYFTVEDKKAPTPYCINLSTALMEDGSVELWACDFDAGAFDNCTPQSWLRFTFNGPEDGFLTPESTPNYDAETRCQGKTFDCSHFEVAQANGGLYPVRVYVWDECNNVDFCMVNLRLVDNQGACGGDPGASRQIAGEVYTEDGKMIEDVMVESNEMLSGLYNMSMTDTDGQYTFGYNPVNMDYELNATKDGDDLNGVTTLDLVLIQKHILQVQTLDSPYQLIAADASNDEKVSSIDLVEIRKLILGIYDEFPSNDSWRFVDASVSLNAENPWPFAEDIMVSNLTDDMMEEDFIAVKIGDVNGSVVTLVGEGDVESRESNGLVLNALPTLIGDGEVSVEVTSENFNDVYGMQFTLEAEGLELTNVQAGALNVTAQNFAVVNGKVTSSWNSEVAVSTNDVLFTLTFKGSNVENVLDINSSITRAEAYVGEDLEIVNVALEGTTDATFGLAQNEPNPFNNTTIVGFELPTNGQATLTVYDVTGQVITIVRGEYNQGYNEIELSKKDMNTSGVLYYQLDSGDFTATKKMIILD